ENNQKIYKKDNFYIISIEIVFFSLIQELYVPDSSSIICLVFCMYCSSLDILPCTSNFFPIPSSLKCFNFSFNLGN
ncbi:MAG: hypothetical protein E6755_09135, partial [Staphylococcus epidermidis]|nr:hypothetical protein [Staphylococcus epidermidis]